MGLVDFLSLLEENDSEMEKEAAEEEAAGRITARGFLDELQKLAQYEAAKAVASRKIIPAKKTVIPTERAKAVKPLKSMREKPEKKVEVKPHYPAPAPTVGAIKTPFGLPGQKRQ